MGKFRLLLDRCQMSKVKCQKGKNLGDSRQILRSGCVDGGGLLAQRRERLPDTQEARGSIPRRPTEIKDEG